MPPSRSYKAVGRVSTSAPSSFAVTRLRSHERDGIGALNRAALDHVGIDAHIRVIVLRCGTQDAHILREVPLRQRSHDAARARTGDPQADVVSDRDRVTDPFVFHEALLIRPRRYDDVRPKPPNLEPPLRIELAQM